MTAQEQWKQAYRRAKYAKDNFGKWEYFDIMATAAMYRREAALERKLEAAQREIDRLKLLLDIANYAVWRERL